MKVKKNLKRIPAFEYAIYLLSMRAQASAVLGEKLHNKGYQAPEIEQAIKRLTEFNYLNDHQFAQIYFDNLKKYKTFGYFGIKQKLLRKKIADKEIRGFLASLSIEEEMQIAKRVTARLKGKSREKVARSLRNKGFRPEIVMRFLKPSQNLSQN